MDDDEYKRILAKMCSLCARGEKCEFDIVQKLTKLEVDNESQQKIIGYLLSNNFIDNQRYANAFVNDKFKFNKWGKQKIKQNLKFKRIENIYIDTSLSSLDNDDYKKVLVDILKKKRKQIKDKQEFVVRQKLLNHAVSKGFEMELVFEIITSYNLSQI